MIVSISNYGVFADAGGDQTARINAAIRKAADDGVDLRFEAGDYKISGRIVLEDGVGLFGSDAGHSRLIAKQGTAAAVISIGDSKSASNVTIDGLVLDNVVIAARGRADNLTITDNLIVDAKGHHQIALNGVSDARVEDNILIRNAPNLGADQRGNSEGFVGYKTKNLEFNANIVGGVTDDIARSSAFSGEQATKIAAYKAAFADYDFFDGGWYSSAVELSRGDINAAITGNILHGVKSGNFPRDHLVYLKTYENLSLSENYFSGFRNDSSGGVKLRNAEGPAIVANNYFDDVSLLTYTLRGVNGRPEAFDQVDIVGNVFDIEKAADFGKGAVFFWDKTNNLSVDDLNIYRNTFKTDSGYDISIITPKGGGKEVFVSGNTVEGGPLVTRYKSDAVSNTIPQADKNRLDRIASDGDAPVFGKAKLVERGDGSYATQIDAPATQPPAPPPQPPVPAPPQPDGSTGGPVATDDNVSTPQNKTILVDVLKNDRHPDGTKLTLESIEYDGKTSLVSIQGDKIKVNPLSWAKDDRIETIRYTVKDSDGKTDTAVLKVGVGKQAPPVAPPAPEPAPPSGEVSAFLDFFLADSAGDEVLFDLEDGARFEAEQLAKATTIYAVALDDASMIGRVVMSFDGHTQTERVAPYALFGDAGGDLRGGKTLAPDSYDLDFEIYAKNGALLEAGTYSFDVI